MQVLKPGLQKGPWTEEEDQIVRETVAKYGVRQQQQHGTCSRARRRPNGRRGGRCAD